MPDDMDRYSRSAAAARLKSARAARYETAAELARVVGMKDVTVRAHENGQNGMGTNNARKYARALGVSAEWLLYGREEGEVAGTDDRMSHERGEMNLETIRRRVPIWQDAREGTFQRVGPYVAEFAEGFLSLLPTGYEAIEADAFRISDDHASAAYPVGTYVVAARPTLMDIREADHVVVARLLPRGSLAETTVRGVQLVDGDIHFTSLREDWDPPTSIGRMSTPHRLPVFADMGGARKRPLRHALIDFLRDVASAIVDPDGTTSRLEAEIERLEQDEAEWKRQEEVWAQVRSEDERHGTPPRFINLTGEEVLIPIGVVLASYRQRERSGRAIARWDRDAVRMEPIPADR